MQAKWTRTTNNGLTTHRAEYRGYVIEIQNFKGAAISYMVMVAGGDFVDGGEFPRYEYTLNRAKSELLERVNKWVEGARK